MDFLAHGVTGVRPVAFCQWQIERWRNADGPGTGFGFLPGQPFLEPGFRFALAVGDGLFCPGDGLLQVFPWRGVWLGGKKERGRVVAVGAVQNGTGVVAEERGQRIEILRRDRIELVVVAGGAAGGQSEPDRRRGIDAVLGINGGVLLRDGPALACRLQQPVIAGGDLLLLRRAGQHVAGNLFDCELIERHVGLVRGYHPIAVRPDAARIIEMNSLRVGVAHRVQPQPCKLLGAGVAGQHAVHRFFVGSVRAGADEGLRLARARRQTCQIKTQPAVKAGSLFLGIGRQAVLRQFARHEIVHRAARPACSVGRHRGLDRRNQRPMFLIFPALGNPLPDQGNFAGIQRIVLHCRRHHVIVGRGDAPHQFGGGGIAFDDDRFAVIAQLVGELLAIQAQRMLLGLARGGIRSMATKAMFGEDGADLVVVGYRFTCGRGGARTGQGRRQQHKAPRALGDEDKVSVTPKAAFFPAWWSGQRNHGRICKDVRFPYIIHP